MSLESEDLSCTLTEKKNLEETQANSLLNLLTYIPILIGVMALMIWRVIYMKKEKELSDLRQCIEDHSQKEINLNDIIVKLEKERRDLCQCLDDHIQKETNANDMIENFEKELSGLRQCIEDHGQKEINANDMIVKLEKERRDLRQCYEELSTSSGKNLLDQQREIDKITRERDDLLTQIPRKLSVNGPDEAQGCGRVYYNRIVPLLDYCDTYSERVARYKTEKEEYKSRKESAKITSTVPFDEHAPVSPVHDSELE